jgi:hypothetical protein
MNTENTTENTTRNEFVQSLVDLGTEWAALGISFGTQALERSAKTLSLAARSLDAISKGLDRRPGPSTPKSADEAVEVQGEVVDDKG